MVETLISVNRKFTALQGVQWPGPEPGWRAAMPRCKQINHSPSTGAVGRQSIDKATKKIVGGKHVAFHFDFSFSDYHKLEPPQVPKEAQKLIASR